jgi:large subunit ribosomal protein L6
MAQYVLFYRNMTIGVTKGHSKNLEIQGIGFRAQATGQKIVMNLGFSHPVEFVVPDSIKVATPKPVEIKLESAE